MNAETVRQNRGGSDMEAIESLLYAFCPKCGKPIGRSKRCDLIELTCSRCGHPLKLTVDQDSKVSVEVLEKKSGKASD